MVPPQVYRYYITTYGAVSNSTNGWVFVSTRGGGVSRFKYELDAISGATTYNSAWAPGIGSDSINTVIVVDDTCQWFGTNKGVGFHTSHLTKKNWFYYSTQNGLICDTVLAIAKDKQGNVWFGTPKGVSKFDGKNTWTNYAKLDGLIDNKIKWGIRSSPVKYQIGCKSND